MNLKKFISGVSALTIAASAFAGMAVTANAAYSEDPDKYKIYWAPDASELPEKISTAGEYEYHGLTISHNGGNDYYGWNGGALYFLAYWNGGVYSTRYIKYTPEKNGKLSFKYTNGKPAVSTSKAAADVLTANDDGSYTLTAGTTYYLIPVGGKCGVYQMTYDYTPAAAGELTVNYVCKGTNIGSSKPDVSKYYMGSSFDYGFPKYVVKDGALYESVNTTYTASTTLSDTAKSVDVEYTKASEGTYQFEDFSGATDFNTASGGSYLKSNASTYGTMTVKESGVYSITTAQKTDGAGSRYVSVKVNGTEIYQTSNNGSSKAFGVETKTDIPLNAGDVITFYGRDSHGAYIDYALLTRTGDIEEKTKDVNYAFTSSVNELKAKEHVYVTVSADGYESSDPVEITNKIQALPDTDSEILLGIKLTMPKELTGVKVVID